MPRPFNFGAGPSMLPESILREAQKELLDWQGTGLSIMETGHRTARVLSLMQKIEADFRSLLTIPEEYSVLFLGFAARAQFSMVPLNLIVGEKKGAYIESGIWSSLALLEAKKISNGYCVASSKEQAFKTLPQYNKDALLSDTAYLYFTPNETINGVRMSKPQSANHIPIVADMTSCLLTEPLNIKEYGLIFAGAQKNISVPGLTLVIVRNDLLQNKPLQSLPTLFDYRTHIEHKSMYATPPLFSCYLAGKMFQWIEMQGGVQALFEINQKKAEKLYQYIDESKFYYCDVDARARSLVNVCFKLTDDALEKTFIQEAERAGLAALKGHRAVGGIRASLYNAMPMEGVEALIQFMHRFSKEYS